MDIGAIPARRWIDYAQIRRNRARSRDLLEPGGANGWLDFISEHAGAGKHLFVYHSLRGVRCAAENDRGKFGPENSESPFRNRTSENPAGRRQSCEPDLGASTAGRARAPSGRGQSWPRRTGGPGARELRLSANGYSDARDGWPGSHQNSMPARSRRISKRTDHRDDRARHEG